MCRHAIPTVWKCPAAKMPHQCDWRTEGRYQLDEKTQFQNTSKCWKYNVSEGKENRWLIALVILNIFLTFLILLIHAVSSSSSPSSSSPWIIIIIFITLITLTILLMLGEDESHEIKAAHLNVLERKVLGYNYKLSSEGKFSGKKVGFRCRFRFRPFESQV